MIPMTESKHGSFSRSGKFSSSMLSAHSSQHRCVFACHIHCPSVPLVSPSGDAAALCGQKPCAGQWLCQKPHLLAPEMQMVLCITRRVVRLKFGAAGARKLVFSLRNLLEDGSPTFMDLNDQKLWGISVICICV